MKGLHSLSGEKICYILFTVSKYRLMLNEFENNITQSEFRKKPYCSIITKITNLNHIVFMEKILS